MSSSPFVLFSRKSLPLCPGCDRKSCGVSCSYADEQQKFYARLNARRLAKGLRKAEDICKSLGVLLTEKLEATIKGLIGDGYFARSAVDIALMRRPVRMPKVTEVFLPFDF